MKKFLLAVAITMCGIAVAQEAPAPKDQGGAKPEEAVAKSQRPQPRRQMPPQMKENMLRQMREAAAALTKKYDADGDGKLNETEKAALDRDMKLVNELLPHAMPYKRLKLVDKDGDMAVSEEEAKGLTMDIIRDSAGRRQPLPRNQRKE